MIPSFQFFVSYLIVDVLCAVLTVIIASNVSRDSGSETQVRYFFLVLTAYLVFVVFDGVWAFLNYSGLVEANPVVLSIVNGINLSAITFDAYFWLCFMLARFRSEVTNRRSKRVLLGVPALLAPILHIVGFFTGQNVITLPDGQIAYGICHTAIVCIQLLYIAAATAFSAYRLHRAKTSSERHLCLIFINFMIPFIIGGIIDTLVAGTPVAAASIVVGLVFVMMTVQDSRISTDALTGLNNRRRADEFLEEKIAHASPARPLFLFLIDLDDFKKINDTYGHLEGDHALQLMADTLRATCSQSNGLAARFGGDEFCIICVDMTDTNPDFISNLIESTLAQTVRNAQVKYDLKCSVGYVSCESPNDDRAQLITQADRMLYDIKRSRKEEKRQGRS